MLNIEVATHLAGMDMQQDDVRKLLIIECVLIFLAFLCSIWGPWWGATLFTLLSGIMIVPLADYYRRWAHNLRVLLEATRNTRTGHLDLM